MSKKDKEKRKKGEDRVPGLSAWMGDLRPQRTASAERRRPSSHPPASPLTRRSTLVAPGMVEAPEGAGAEDLGVDVAPVGPTEQAGASAPQSVPPAAAPAPVASMSMEQLQQQIRELEARLDEMISGTVVATPPRLHPRPCQGRRRRTSCWSPRATTPARPRAICCRPTSTCGSGAGPGMRKRAEEVDEFGHDPKYEARFLPFFDFLYEHLLPRRGGGHRAHPGGRRRCLLVANHSGGPLPYDGIMLRTTVRSEHARIGAARASCAGSPRTSSFTCPSSARR